MSTTLTPTFRPSVAEGKLTPQTILVVIFVPAFVTLLTIFMYMIARWWFPTRLEYEQPTQEPLPNNEEDDKPPSYEDIIRNDSMGLPTYSESLEHLSDLGVLRLSMGLSHARRHPSDSDPEADDPISIIFTDAVMRRETRL